MVARLYGKSVNRMVARGYDDTQVTTQEAVIEIRSRTVGRGGGQSIGAQVLEPIHKRPRIYPDERHCPVCSTKLNRYNKGPFCGIHTPTKQPRVRGRNKENR